MQTIRTLRASMRGIKILTLVLLGTFVILFQYIVIRFYDTNNFSFSFEKSLQRSNEHVVIVSVICGLMSQTALVMIKSAILFKSESQLTFVIFAEFHLQTYLRIQLQRLQSRLPLANSFSFELRNISYPDDGYDRWRNELQKQASYKACSLLRLYLPVLVTNYSEVLYIDLDVIFLNELSDVWRHLHQMNASQLAAVVPDHEDPHINPYRERPKNIIPFYGDSGLNAGVMLMNLEKMREIKWVDEMNAILVKYLEKLDVFDQDIVNIFFHYHPDKLYLNSCRYNYAWFACIGDNTQCMKRSLCKDAPSKGISILHGHSFAFNWIEIFRATYEIFSDYELGTDVCTNLIEPLRRRFQNANCSLLENEFLLNLVRLCDNK